MGGGRRRRGFALPGPDRCAAEVALLRERSTRWRRPRRRGRARRRGRRGQDPARGRHRRGRRPRGLPGAHRTRGAGPRPGGLPRARGGVPRGVPLGARARLPGAGRAWGAHLGRLVPGWRSDTTGGPDDSPLLLAEAVVRLFAGARRGPRMRPRAGGPPLGRPGDARRPRLPRATACARSLCCASGTTRPEGDAAELSRTAGPAGRGPGAAVRIAPLPDADVDRMVAACLGTPTPPSGLTAFVHAHGEPAPRSWSRSCSRDSSRRARCVGEDGVWTAAGELTPTVPASLRESIRAPRWARSIPTARARRRAPPRCWAAASTGSCCPASPRSTGGRPSTRCGPPSTRSSSRSTATASSSGTPSPARPCSATCSRPSAATWPRGRGRPSSGPTPACPGAVCELAAELAEAAGAPAAAAERLVESARRALAAGALATAEATARRARRLAAARRPGRARRRRDRSCSVLVAAGKPVDGAGARRDLVDRLPRAGASAERRATSSSRLARAALAAGDVDGGRARRRRRRAGGGRRRPTRRSRPGSTPSPRAVALDQVRLDDAVPARPRARWTRPTRPASPRSQCEALEVLGRAVRRPGRRPGRAAVVPAGRRRRRAPRAGRVAPAGPARAGDPRAGPTAASASSRATRDLAARYGALVTVAVMDLSLADIALIGLRPGRLPRPRPRACAEASRRYGLATEPVAHLWLAGRARARGRRRRRCPRPSPTALAHDPGDPRILGDLHGRVLVDPLVRRRRPRGAPGPPRRR